MGKRCIVPGCGWNPASAEGFCSLHLSRIARGMPPSLYEFYDRQNGLKTHCSAADCPTPANSSGVCRKHFRRKKLSELLGLVWFTRDHKLSVKYPTIIVGGKRIPAHKYVAEKALGRALRSGEMVHHVNGDTIDYANRNLVIMTREYHSQNFRRLHPWIGSGRKNAIPFTFKRVSV